MAQDGAAGTSKTGGGGKPTPIGRGQSASASRVFCAVLKAFHASSGGWGEKGGSRRGDYNN